ncbi:ABC transporter substrate-binding protein [Paenibacillus sp. HW567]|uniref:ABC transporter substrate-binding protein n=1 Tax=Paenibacillus sp. HW567 TaxID=1034769 RepID=UPI00036FFF33|nr:ABC transporter substrate-binding protein [Paenibacillus sp. HW567]
MARSWRTAFFLLGLLPLLLTACGTAPGKAIATNTAAAGSLTITDFAGREINFAGTPQHIVALGNGETEIIYALGGTLAGRPTATVPVSLKAAEGAMQIGSAHEIDLEKLAYLKADAVLGNERMNAKDIPAVEGIGARMVLTRADSVDDIKQQILLFGQMLGKEQKAEQLVSGIESGIQERQVQLKGPKPRVLLVYGAPGTYMAALPSSLGGNLLELAGGANIAAEYPALQGYPQYAALNPERVVEANPQFILIMTHGNAEEAQRGFEQEMRQNAAWSSLDAVVHNRVSVLPSELFGTNPGTRVTEALQLLTDLFAGTKTQ